MMRETNLPKIEVLIDKVNLVFQAIKESDQPEPYDLRLLQKYLGETLALVSEIADDSGAQAPGGQQEFVNQSTAKLRASGKDLTSAASDATPKDADSSDNVSEQEKGAKDPTPHRITPIEDHAAGRKEIQQSNRKSSTVEFVADDNADDTPLEPGNEEGHSSDTDEKKVTGNDETYDEIFRQLEEIKRNRQKFYEENPSISSNHQEKATHNLDDEERQPVRQSLVDESQEKDDLSLNEQFKPESSDLAEHLKQKPIRSLVQEIDLNDKFWFINELFEGNGTVFNQLLRDLDSLTNLEEAKELVRERSKDMDWSDKERAEQKLYNLLGRRY